MIKAEVVQLESALLATEYSSSSSGEHLSGVFSAVTPLGDIENEGYAQTRCFAFLKFVGVRKGDVVALRLDVAEADQVEIKLLEGLTETPIEAPFTVIVPMLLDHYSYGLHRVIVMHNGLRIGAISFEVKRMPTFR